MKILEVLTPSVDIKTYNGLLRPSKNIHTSRHSTIGKRSNSEWITRYNHSPLRHQEGFDFFIKYVTRVAPENPIFPKIRNITKINDKYGNHINKYTVERLLDSKNLAPDTLKDVMYNYFNEQYVADVPPSAASIAYLINTCLSGAGITNKIVKDNNLRQAIKILRDMYDKADKICTNNNLIAIRDLHADNVMLRKTANTFEIVLNDPLLIRN